VKACRDHKVRYSITAPQNAAVKWAIEGIAEEACTPIDYTENGEAWVAATPHGERCRLVVRRTRLADPQPALFPTFRYHALITDREGDPVLPDADHPRRGRRARDQSPQGGIGALALPVGPLCYERRMDSICHDRPQPPAPARRPRGVVRSSRRRSGDDSSAFRVGSRAGRDGANSTCRRTRSGPQNGPDALNASACSGPEPPVIEITCGVPWDLEDEHHRRQAKRLRPRFGQRPSASGDTARNRQLRAGRSSHRDWMGGSRLRTRSRLQGLLGDRARQRRRKHFIGRGWPPGHGY
jgi:hypothetical protein